MSSRTQGFRRCAGEFATGVTVVTVPANDAPAGMTVNAFASISLEPLLVMIALTKATRTLEAIEADSRFAISVLERQQANVALAFARRGAPFPADHVEERDGCLAVRGALAIFDCRLADIVTTGDHRLVIGAVTDFEQRPGEPLLFHRSSFGSYQRGIQELVVGSWDLGREPLEAGRP